MANDLAIAAKRGTADQYGGIHAAPSGSARNGRRGPASDRSVEGSRQTRVKADAQLSSRYQVTQTGPDKDGRVLIHKRLRELPEVIAATGTTISGGSDWYMSIREGDPNSSVWRLEWFDKIQRGDWNTTTRSTLELRSTENEFLLKESITALENEKVVFEKAWDNQIKRDLI